jgi:hypothetical protein
MFRYLLDLGQTSTFLFHIKWCSIIKKSLIQVILRPHSDWHSPFQLPLRMPCIVPKPLAIRSASFLHDMGGAKTLGNSQPSGNLTSSADDPPSHLSQFTKVLGMPALRYSRVVGVSIYPIAWNILPFVRRYFISSGIPQANKSTATLHGYYYLPDLSVHMLPSIDSLHSCKSIQCMVCHPDDQLIRFRR